MSALSAERGSMSALSVERGSMSVLLTERGSMLVLSAERGSMSALTAERGSMSVLSTERGSMSVLSAERGRMSALLTERGSMLVLSAERGSMSALSAERGSMSALSAERGSMSVLSAERGSMSALSAERGGMSALLAERGSMSALSAERGSMSVPDWLKEAFFNPELERHRINIHQYCDSDNVRTMRKMDDLHLLDFIKLRLKSKGDFDTAYDVVMSTGLAFYMKTSIVFQPGDWPCQFYCRQIIYESLKKFIGYHPGFPGTLQGHDNILTDHSSYSFPLTSGATDNLLNDNLPQNTSQPSILSIVPTIGPRHISLNSREHIVNSYHPFFF